MFTRPDWRDSKPYKALESVSLEHMAWEFLRRNPDYLKSWEEYVASVRKIAFSDPAVARYAEVLVSYRESADAWRVLGDDAAIDTLGRKLKDMGFWCADPGFPGRTGRLDGHYGRTWGLKRLIHPGAAYNWQTVDFLQTAKYIGITTAFGVGSLVKPGGLQSLQDTKWLPVVIDLTLPLKVIDMQLKNIVRLERRLRTADKTIQPINSRDVTPKRYAEYVHILDARATGLTASEIGAALEPRRTNHAESRQRNKRYAAALKEAERLQSDGYRMLPLLQHLEWPKEK